MEPKPEEDYSGLLPSMLMMGREPEATDGTPVEALAMQSIHNRRREVEYGSSNRVGLETEEPPGIHSTADTVMVRIPRSNHRTSPRITLNKETSLSLHPTKDTDGTLGKCVVQAI